jgi:hypothetical protein
MTAPSDPPAGMPYVENPYTGLLKEVHWGGLAVHFGAADGPPITLASKEAHELFEAS